MKKYSIGILPGDGIGPEVTESALRFLNPISKKFDIQFNTNFYPYSTEYWLKNDKKQMLTDEIISDILSNDAVLVGAIGDPRAPIGLLEREIIGGLRWRGDLFVNLRPVKLISEQICPIKNIKPEDVDFIVVRENTEDAYPGIGGNMKKGFENEVAISVAVYTRNGVERIVRYTLELTKKLKRKKVTLLDKVNAIPAQKIYRRILSEIQQNEYPEIEIEFMFIDSGCMQIIRNPSHFDVILTTNMFGDILTDLAAEIQGGIGVAASGCINPDNAALFEPVHGSAYQYAGQNVVCPIAQINSLAMMLEYLGEIRVANAIQKAIKKAVIEENIPLSIPEIKSRGFSTTIITDIILSKFRK